MKRTELSVGSKSRERGTTFSAERRPLERKPLKRLAVLGDATQPPKPKPKRRRSISPAHPSQRARVAGKVCAVSDCGATHCDPAHLIDRSLGGDDDPRATVPLCRPHHDAYDDGDLSLLEHLEPHFREELAYAVEMVGLMTALKRITNRHWIVDPRDAHKDHQESDR
jgi:hypothetical protein